MQVARKSIECKVSLDEDEFVGGFSPVLMEAAAAWHRGVRFADLMIMYKDKVRGRLLSWSVGGSVGWLVGRLSRGTGACASPTMQG